MCVLCMQIINSNLTMVSRVTRRPTHPVLPIFINRRTSHIMSGKPVTKKILMSLFEAARWAPSSYNEQPWKFIYALRNTPAWDLLFPLLVPYNQQWAQEAGALIIILSKKTFTRNNKQNDTHLFDAGAAWMSLTLQAQSMGLFANAIGGFDHEKARYQLAVGDDYDICAMVAVGYPGSVFKQAKEKISLRKPIDTFAIEASK